MHASIVWVVFGVIFMARKCEPFNSWDNPFIVKCMPHVLDAFKGIALTYIY